MVYRPWSVVVPHPHAQDSRLPAVEQHRRSAPMASRADIDNLNMTLAEALELASEGDIADGYECLLRGRHRARQTREGAEPAERDWLEDAALERRWQEAQDRYAARYGIGRG